MTTTAKTHKTSMKKGRFGKSDSVYSNMAIDLKLWSREPNSITIARFYTSRDIPEVEFFRMCSVDEGCKTALKYASAMCGLNRERISMEKNLNMNHVVSYPLGQYLDVYKKEMQDRAKLKDEQNQVNAEVIAKVMQDHFKPFDDNKDKDGK